jgi:cytoskeletal protein RodZ
MNKNKTKTSVEKQPKSKYDKISLIVGIVLCAILLPILALNVSLIIIDATNGTMPPAIAGYSPANSGYETS